MSGQGERFPWLRDLQAELNEARAGDPDPEARAEVERRIARRAGTLSEADAALDLSEVDLMARRRAGSLTEADVDEALRRRGQPTAADFRAVGLSESDAALAARGLVDGTYLGFEDACLSRAIFGHATRSRLDETAMRATAARFAKPVSS